MKAPFAVAAISSLLLLACSGPSPAPVPLDDGTIFTFAPVGPQTFLNEPNPGALDKSLRGLLAGGGPDEATRAYSNRWVQPPGWLATVDAFGEPTAGDLYASTGYPYRTNLVDPVSGVVVLAYTKEQPADDLWKAQQAVQVSGRLEGYARQASGIVILLDAKLEGTGGDASEEASVAVPAPGPG